MHCWGSLLGRDVNLWVSWFIIVLMEEDQRSLMIPFFNNFIKLEYPNIPINIELIKKF